MPGASHRGRRRRKRPARFKREREIRKTNARLKAELQTNAATSF